MLISWGPNHTHLEVPLQDCDTHLHFDEGTTAPAWCGNKNKNVTSQAQFSKNNFIFVILIVDLGGVATFMGQFEDVQAAWVHERFQPPRFNAPF